MIRDAFGATKLREHAAGEDDVGLRAPGRGRRRRRRTRRRRLRPLAGRAAHPPCRPSARKPGSRRERGRTSRSRAGRRGRCAARPRWRRSARAAGSRGATPPSIASRKPALTTATRAPPPVRSRRNAAKPGAGTAASMAAAISSSRDTVSRPTCRSRALGVARSRLARTASSNGRQASPIRRWKTTSLHVAPGDRAVVVEQHEQTREVGKPSGCGEWRLWQRHHESILSCLLESTARTPVFARQADRPARRSSGDRRVTSR